MAESKALHLLLSWGKEEAKSIQCSHLAAHVAKGKGSSSVVKELCELVVGSQSDEQCCLVLTLLADAIASLSDAALLAEYPQLCSTLRWGLGRGGGAPTTRAVCTATTQLVTRVHSSHNVVKNFSSHHLPFLLAPLLSLAQTGPTLQPPALAALSHCLVLFQSTTLQHKAVIKSIALQGMFRQHSQDVSQECCRLFVLLTHCNPSHWTDMLGDLLSTLDHMLCIAYKPVSGESAPLSPLPLELPPIPAEEPQCSMVLVNAVSALSRALCYALTFPPPASSLVSIPLERALTVIFHGLSVMPQQVLSVSTEALLLVGLLPTLHTAMWNILCAMITSCRSHLLTYAAGIEQLLLHGLGSAHAQHCCVLQLKVHHVIGEWVKLRRDADKGFINPVLRWLMEEGRGEKADIKEDVLINTPQAKRKKLSVCVENEKMSRSGIVSEVQLSSLSTLVAVVTHLGPVLPSLPAELLRWFPSELLSSSPPPPPPIAKLALDLLGACTASTNPSLTLPLNSAIHTFTMYGTHQDLKVRQASEDGLHVCNLIQHPSILPTSTTSSHMHTSSRELDEGKVQSHVRVESSPSHHSIKNLPTTTSKTTAEEIHTPSSIVGEKVADELPSSTYQLSSQMVGETGNVSDVSAKPKTRSVAKKAVRHKGLRGENRDTKDRALVIVSSGDDALECDMEATTDLGTSHSSNSSLIVLSPYQPPPHGDARTKIDVEYTESDEELLAQFVDEPPDFDCV